MMQLNLLFLAPHWRVSLVRTFQAAKARLGFSGKLVGADSDPLAASLKVVDKRHILPSFDDSTCKNQLIDICRQETIQSILPMTNKAIEFLNYHRNELDQDNLLAYLQDSETIEICHDKQKLARFFESESIPSPVTGSAKMFAEIDHFPLIAKPRRGEGGKDNFIIETQRDLEFYAQKYPGHVLQKFIHGKEYTVDWFSDKTGKPILIVPRQRLQVRGGEVMVSKICMDSGIIELARQLGLRLKLSGPANLQGILTEDGQFLFTDVNLRFGSGAGHTIAAGGDIPGYLYKDLTDEADLTESPSVQNGSVMTRFHDAFFSPELDG
jgi:carbamoyl-phosphate synthase large subunit